MQDTRRTSILAALFFAPVLFLCAGAPVNPAGHWEGVIQSLERDVNIEVDLTRSSKGDLTGTITIPKMNLNGLTLADFGGAKQSIQFQIKGTPGDRAFKGTFSDDGLTISGDFTMEGNVMPFRLTRTGEARVAVAVKNPPIGKDLEGTWNGSMSVEGKVKHFVLKLANQEGAAAGSLFSVEDGFEVSIAAISQKAASVSLGIQAVGGSFAGTLQGTELTGTWTEGPAVLAMNFRRATP